MKQWFDRKHRVKRPAFVVSDWIQICRPHRSHMLGSRWNASHLRQVSPLSTTDQSTATDTHQSDVHRTSLLHGQRSQLHVHLNWTHQLSHCKLSLIPLGPARDPPYLRDSRLVHSLSCGLFYLLKRYPEARYRDGDLP